MSMAAMFLPPVSPLSRAPAVCFPCDTHFKQSELDKYSALGAFVPTVRSRARSLSCTASPTHEQQRCNVNRSHSSSRLAVISSALLLGAGGSASGADSGAAAESSFALREAASPTEAGLVLATPAKLQQRTPDRMQQARESWIQAAAQRRAAQEAAKQKRISDVAQATRAIFEHLMSMQETAPFAHKVVELMKKESESRFLKAAEGSSVNADMVEPFCLQAKRLMFRQAWLSRIPGWCLSSTQNNDLIDRILRKLSSSRLRDKSFSYDVYRDSLFEALDADADPFRCPVCADPLVTRMGSTVDSRNMWFAPVRRTEHWTNNPCGHACCRSCIASWTETQINDQKANIRCPMPGCSYNLWDQDIKALVTDEVFERHQEHKHGQNLKRLRLSLKKDPALKSWLKANARPCPDCHVIVSRSEGCNDMGCVCGTHFCYQCGFKKCQCGNSNRRDIWNVRNVRSRSVTAQR